MWVVAVFDLPTHTKVQRKRYAGFRKLLLHHGFTMLQYSVYVRNLPTMHQAQALIKQLGPQTPPQGKSAFMMMTDKQYGLTKNFYGPALRQEKIPKKYDQLILFEDF
ncbi:MAG: CRISPR-associated endonuclease Cas2 [Elusimicrobiaceae bacterium]|nr:CRISPR-associated endonuclease Cas2 [Elusimicrobiaceae bacterium]